MAKKHVIKYFLDLQNQYVEMIGQVEDLKEALNGGFINQEQYEQAVKDIDTVRNNYERIAYIMFELNKPNKKSKEGVYNNTYKHEYDYLKGSSKEAVMNENDNALSDLRKMIKDKNDKVVKDDNQ